MFSFRDILRYFMGGSAKKSTVFASERQAYDFARQVYKDTGGVTPELRRMYEFYQKSVNEHCDTVGSELRDSASRNSKATVTVQLRRPADRQVGEKLRA